MAGDYPTIQATATYSGANASTHAVTMPAGVVVGDLLIMFFVSDAPLSRTYTKPPGWQDAIFDSSNQCGLVVFYKKADGTEGATETVTINSSEAACAVTYRIDNMRDPDVKRPQASSGATGASDKPDPDALRPTPASTGVWLAAHGHDGNLRTTDAFPTGYSNGQSIEIGTLGGCGVGTAQRENNPVIGTEDPAAFTISASDQWVACTVYVAPNPSFGFGGSGARLPQMGVG